MRAAISGVTKQLSIGMIYFVRTDTETTSNSVTCYTDTLMFVRPEQRLRFCYSVCGFLELVIYVDLASGLVSVNCSGLDLRLSGL